MKQNTVRMASGAALAAMCIGGLSVKASDAEGQRRVGEQYASARRPERAVDADADRRGGGGPEVGSLPARATVSDDRIEDAFRKSYVHTTHLKDDKVKIEARDGVVTLTGTVANPSRKSLAEQTASSLPGVIRVDNQLSTTDQEATSGSDAWINTKVKTALMFHRNVQGLATSVDVKNGVVTLTGEAESLAQKELTGAYAADIEGVTRVNNQLTVVAPASDRRPEPRTAGVRLDDASITAQVKAALLTHRSTSALDVKVQTREGEVTLTGIAANDAEKSLVGKLVHGIHGVTSVKNDMTIQRASMTTR